MPRSGLSRAWLASLGLATLGGLRLAIVPDAAAQSVEGALDGLETPQSVEDPVRAAEIDAMTAQIGATLRCPVCRQQSVAESSSRIARDMQGVIRGMLVEGRTPEEIEAYFLEAYGDWILLKPKARGLNWLVYLGPAGAFLLGGWFVARRLRGGRPVSGAVAADYDERAAKPTDDVVVGERPRDGLDASDRAWLDSAIRGS